VLFDISASVADVLKHRGTPKAYKTNDRSLELLEVERSSNVVRSFLDT
jgi:hypothetical protein